MDNFDLMEENELLRKRIEELLEDSTRMIRYILHEEKIIKAQHQYADDLWSQLQNLKDQQVQALQTINKYQIGYNKALIAQESE